MKISYMFLIEGIMEELTSYSSPIAIDLTEVQL